MTLKTMLYSYVCEEKENKITESTNDFRDDVDPLKVQQPVEALSTTSCE